MKAFKILSFVMAALLAVPSLWAGALTLQSAEDAKEIIAAAPAASLAVSESDKSRATTAEEAAKEFPEYDPDFGQRIYFNNFHDEPQSLVGAFVFDAGAASVVDGIPVVAGSGAGFINTAYYGIGVHADGDTFVIRRRHTRDRRSVPSRHRQGGERYVSASYVGHEHGRRVGRLSYLLA